MAKRIRLTKKRQKWVKGRSVVMRGKPLRNSITAEDRYAKKLEALTRTNDGRRKPTNKKAVRLPRVKRVLRGGCQHRQQREDLN